VLVFISGGVRSGKSSLGEKLAAALADGNRKIYLATARYYDEEIAKRILIHQQNRADKSFLTMDKSSSIGDMAPLLKKQDTVLLDCLGTLLANEMFEEAVESEPNYAVLNYPKICKIIIKDLAQLQKKVANLIVISNEVFSDGIFYTSTIEAYIKALAELHIRLAANSDLAIECVYGGYHCHKGSVPKMFGKML
jgi:adenosylcobinamide kinase/adenosylcobinamide-phosphate guanylyltransferase